MNADVLVLLDTLKTLVAESSEILNVVDFVRNFSVMYFRCFCGFLPVVCFRNDQLHFYIRHLDIMCEDHAKLFIDFAVPSNSEHLSSGQMCLKFLKTFHGSPSRFSIKHLGGNYQTM